MRRILLLPIILLAILSFAPTQQVHSQTVELFCTDFDSLGIDSFYMQRSRIPSSSTVLFEKDSVVTKNNSPFSATDTVGNGSTSYLTSPRVGIANFDDVGVSFDQICYLDWFDRAIVEYSFDGTNWASLPPSINNSGNVERVYTGNSLYQGQSPIWYFSKLSSPQIWRFMDSAFIFTRNTTAWVTESFNVTPVIDREARNNNGTPPDSMQIRLALNDNPASPAGRTGLHRWWVENFCIRGSNCELTPPNIILDDPPVNYPRRYEDRVYWLGPYNFNAQITDQSLVDSAFVEYYIKRDTNGLAPGPRELIFRDTLSMNFLGFSRYEIDIPRDFNHFRLNTLDSIKPGDTLCWRLVAIDGSPCSNIRQDPPAGFTCFEVRGNLPLACGTQPIFNFPYYQTFNGPDFLVSTSGVLAESWVNAEGDFHDFYVTSGAPDGYPATGPSDDFPGSGKYLLLEASGFRDSTAYLLSPCIDLSENPNNLVRFYLNQNGDGGDTVHFDVFDPTPIANFPAGRFINDVIPPIGGNKGDNWLPYEFGTFQFQNKVIQFRFRATPASATENSDIGLDSFKIVPAPVCDLRMDRVILGPYIPSNIQDPALLNVQNVGALPTDSFFLSYEVIRDGVTLNSFGPIKIVDVIPPGTNKTYTLDGLNAYQTPLGEYTIRAWLDYACDEVRSNDTTVANSRGIQYKPINCSKEYFDNDTLWTGLGNDTATSNNKWEIGTPDFDRTNSAFTEPNSWDVLLNSGYSGSGSVEQLITQFYDTRGADSVIISFMNNRAMENTQDGVFIEYSLDRGNTWDYLDNLDDTLTSKRWYNSFLSAGGFGGQFCFSDTTRHDTNNWNNWVESELMLPDELENQPEVLFRFIFFAEEEPGGSAGMSIDNFLLYDQNGIDLESQHMLQPSSKCDLTATQPFYTIVKNRGNQPINSFDITYIVDGPNPNQRQINSETINRTVMPRDTIHLVTSGPKFDFSLFGYYDVATVVSTPGDVCSANDTLWKEVENIDGCSFIFEAITGPYTEGKTAVDSSFWRFEITNGNEEYLITDDYVDFKPVDTNRRLICIKDGSTVKFTLGDVDTAIAVYSFIAFDGQNDTIFVDQESGGASAPKLFEWNCPPERSAELLDVRIRNNFVLPVEDDYRFDVMYRNNGLDSINFVEVGLQIDDVIYRQNDTINPPNPEGLQYTRKRSISFSPPKLLKPGLHDIIAWVHDPNGLPDLLPIDDTLKLQYTVIDTSTYSGLTGLDSNGNPIDIPNAQYCTSFEDSAEYKWIAINPYWDNVNNAKTQLNQSFERGTPSQTLINSAYHGDKVWMTGTSSNYKNVDSTSLLSPFFRLSRDSCYKVSFYNNYVIRDRFNDGGQLQISGDFGQTWETIFYGERDSLTFGDTTVPILGNYQKNWHNARHIKAIPDNSKNSGWTGQSGGWVLSENVFGGGLTQLNTDGKKDYLGVLRFRFESDATITDEGWAVDSFCLEKIDPSVCLAVGLEEQLANAKEDEVYIGQNIPNPAKQSTSIPYYLPGPADVNLRVINVMGQMMYTQNQSVPQGSGYFDIDITNYAQGIYYYTVEVDGKAYTKKMIVTK